MDEFWEGYILILLCHLNNGQQKQADEYAGQQNFYLPLSNASFSSCFGCHGIHSMYSILKFLYRKQTPRNLGVWTNECLTVLVSSAMPHESGE